MKYYFQLQYQLLLRHLKGFGLPSFLALILAILAFVGSSEAIFIKTPLAPQLYLVLGLYAVFRLNEKNRIDFLLSFFPTKLFYQVRLIENLLISLPFCCFLLYKKAFLWGLAFLILAAFLAFYREKKHIFFVLPTPFYRYPYEFILGFRQTFFLFIFPYIILYSAVSSEQIELGIVAILLLNAFMLGFYSEVEKEFFVWIHAFSPHQFLFYKIKTALLYSSFLSLPITIVLLVTFPEKFHYFLLTQVIAYLYIITFTLSKYINYPDKIDIVNSIFLVIGIIFPPFLLINIPIFYSQAEKKIRYLLYDSH